MKKIVCIALFALSFALGAITTPKPAQAWVGAMCFNTEGCNDKCEVCVKERQFDSYGRCMKIAGCY